MGGGSSQTLAEHQILQVVAGRTAGRPRSASSIQGSRVGAMTARDAQEKLRSLADPALAASATRFFKTGPGEYGEHDVFLGLRAATLRQLAKEHHGLPLEEVETLLQSEIHEARSLA